MEIKHDKEAQKFYLVNEGKESYVLYRMQKNNIMNIFRTYVPPEKRNKGLAGKVVKAALDYARENNLKVIPACSYTEYFISKNKEYEDLVKNPSP
jgi:uncharacterized protein